ncbi:MULTISPECIES: PQQ-binding-like beta-propeller repeat protein [unclassified Streptomyces]|uniref:outer membrane protein assembly factor BamB family protein n=1 Tax=unclassified Streptomyces TaxID=2593676 RepID=UPI003701F70E
MTQPPPPPNQPPQPPQQPGGYGTPQPAQPPAAPQTPPAAQAGPPAPGAAPNLNKSPQPAPGSGYPQQPPQAAPQPQQPPQAAPQTPQPPQGAPQTPPPPMPGQQPSQPQPGYGYPQAGQPPQQPPAPPGYGYPGQPQPPYGQQPGYGYPQPATTPMQPQASPGGGRKVNPQIAIIVAAVVACALIIGSGVWYSNSKGKDDTASSAGPTGGGSGGSAGGGGGSEKVPDNPASRVLFQVPMPAVADDDSVSVNGSWLTDKVYAKAGVAEIVGYDPVKGSKLWSIPLPGPVCTASKHASADGKAAIVFEPAMPTKDKPSHGCSQVAALDLTTGRKLWTQTAKNSDELATFDNVTLSGGTVAAGGLDGGAAWDAVTGKSLWAPKAADTCEDAGYGGGEKLVAVRKCGSYDNPTIHIQTIDPKSGKVFSDYKMSAGIDDAAVVSTNPLVVGADVGDTGNGSGVSDIFSIDNATGQLKARISLSGDGYAETCDTLDEVENCHGLVVGNGKLYVSTEEHDGTGDHGRTNEIVAFDLTTGKQTGQRADAGDGYTYTPLRMDGSNVIAYKRPPYDKGGQVVSIDGTTFKATTLLENPATESVRDVETSMLPDHAELIFANGRLYMADVFARKPTAGDRNYLAIAFGPQ